MTIDAAAAVDRSQEIIDNIEKVKGVNYAKIVKHSLGLNLLVLVCPDPFLRDMVVKATSNLMSDLAEAYGIDVKDKNVTDELRSNIMAVMPNELKG